MSRAVVVSGTLIVSTIAEVKVVQDDWSAWPMVAEVSTRIWLGEGVAEGVLPAPLPAPLPVGSLASAVAVVGTGGGGVVFPPLLLLLLLLAGVGPVAVEVAIRGGGGAEEPEVSAPPAGSPYAWAHCSRVILSGQHQVAPLESAEQKKPASQASVESSQHTRGSKVCRIREEGRSSPPLPLEQQVCLALGSKQ